MIPKKRRLDTKPSRTAGFTCMCRAASNLESKDLYRSNDYIAPKLLPRLALFSLRLGLLSPHRPPFPKGMYEYVIVRTKYIDTIVRNELQNIIDQILIFGAGFDSRALRFEGAKPGTTFFELDSRHTQEAKIRQFRKRGIPLPKKTVYIPIDLSIEPVKDALVRNGFNPGKRTLFILEGLVMYLESNAVQDLFSLLYNLSSPGSRIVFDYIHASVLREENRCYGEKAIYKTVKNVNESWRFGIESGEIESYTRRLGFDLIENLTPVEMERHYFYDEAGNRAGRVNGTHCIAFVGK